MCDVTGRVEDLDLEPRVVLGEPVVTPGFDMVRSLESSFVGVLGDAAFVAAHVASVPSVQDLDSKSLNLFDPAFYLLHGRHNRIVGDLQRLGGNCCWR